MRKYDSRDPLEIIRGEKIKIIFSDSLNSLLGLYTYNWRHRIIIVNNRLDHLQLPVVLAHELGHDMLHRELAKGKTLQEFHLFDSVSQTENEANMFAAHLLLPDDTVLELAETYKYDTQHIAGALNTNVNLVLLKLDELRLRGYPIAPADPADGKFLKKEKLHDETAFIA